MGELFITSLDIPTLAFVRGLVQLMLGGLLLYLGTRDEHAHGARLWAIGFFLNGLSLFVFPLNVPPAWETPRTVVNHLSLGGSSVFLLLGFWAFGRQRTHWWVPILLIVIPIFSLVAWEGLWPNARWRILTTASGQALFLLALQYSLRSPPRPELVRFYRRLRYVVFAYLAVFVWSYGSIADVLPTTARLDLGYHRVIFSVVTLLFMLSLAVGCLALQFVLIAARNADLARIDWLTGLLNRRGFFAEAGRNEPIRAGQGGVVVLDIDHFKQINDRHGHATGDRVLQALGAALRELTEPDHLVARMGGEEFCIVVPGADPATATVLAEAIRAHCAQLRIEAEGGRTIGFTISVGVSQLIPGCSLERALATADGALYLAKQQGRNRVGVAPDLQGDSVEGPSDASARMVE